MMKWTAISNNLSLSKYYFINHSYQYHRITLLGNYILQYNFFLDGYFSLFILIIPEMTKKYIKKLFKVHNL